MQAQEFRSAEYGGWQAKAGAYDDWFGRLTAKLIPTLLEGLDAAPGATLLDVACGTGELVTEAGARGLTAVGLDFAPNMIAEARRLHPAMTFVVGDAEDLPYPDRHFDAVSCAFGLMHLAAPEQAVAEAFRVLRPGGRFAITAWCSADQGGELFEIVGAAVNEHAAAEPGPAAAPSMFRFADTDECRRVLTAAGFNAIGTEVVPVVYRPDSARAVFDLVVRSTVRTALAIDRQTEARKSRILQAVTDGVGARRRNGACALAMPALLTIATKPASPEGLR